MRWSSQPVWAELPSVQDFQASFPKSQNGVNSVRVVLGCAVEAGGGLSGCSVAQEDPAGQGYGAGALALASKFKLAPWSQDGSPTVGAHIKLPIRYALTPTPAAKPQRPRHQRRPARSAASSRACSAAPNTRPAPPGRRTSAASAADCRGLQDAPGRDPEPPAGAGDELGHHRPDHRQAGGDRLWPSRR